MTTHPRKLAIDSPVVEPGEDAATIGVELACMCAGVLWLLALLVALGDSLYGVPGLVIVFGAPFGLRALGCNVAAALAVSAFSSIVVSGAMFLAVFHVY